LGDEPKNKLIVAGNSSSMYLLFIYKRCDKVKWDVDIWMRVSGVEKQKGEQWLTKIFSWLLYQLEPWPNSGSLLTSFVTRGTPSGTMD